ncbi:MAG: hypothetical protein ACYTF6_05765 [Planctomycetota bacterium]|jgi:hypothetical protein
MKKIRRLLPWVGLACIVALIALSIRGAFLGAERAREFFTSTALAVFWIFLAVAALAGVFFFRRARRSPGLLAMHLGWVLITAGGLWASQAGHSLEAKLGMPKKIREAYMELWEGEPTAYVLNRELDSIIGELDFALELKKFWIEYYPIRDPQWHFAYIVFPEADKPPVTAKLSWQIGRPMRIPHTDVDLTILYFAAKPDKVPEIRGHRPLRAAATLKLTRGLLSSPANLLFVEEGRDGCMLELDSVYASPSDWVDAGSPRIFLAGWPQQPRAYKAEVSVQKAGRETERSVVEINKPLHYGGYHFYFPKQDPARWERVALIVRSDSGLWAAYGGFMLLGAGAFWHFWLWPAVKLLRRRRR